MYRLVLLSLLLLCSATAFAEPVKTDEAMIRKDVDLAHLTVLGLTPGVSNMLMVQSTLGTGIVEKLGTGERATERLCYMSTKKGDYTKVIFEAPAAKTQNRAASIVTVIKIYAGDVRYDSEGNCNGSDKVSSNTATKSGIGLYTRETELRERLAEPTESWPGYVSYEYHALLKLSKKEVNRQKAHWPFVLKYPYIDIHSSIEARYYKGALKRLDLSRIVAKP